MKYTQEHCNVSGYNHPIYRNYMCKEHYDFYLTDEKCRKKMSKYVRKFKYDFQ